MSEPLPVCDLDEFCGFLSASRIVDVNQLTALREEFDGDVTFGVIYGESLTGFTRFLVAKDIVTCWQIAKLRQRKYKGFLLDEYFIYDLLGYDNDGSRYLARDIRTKQLVILCVRPADRRRPDGEPEYSVEEFRP